MINEQDRQNARSGSPALDAADLYAEPPVLPFSGPTFLRPAPADTRPDILTADPAAARFLGTARPYIEELSGMPLALAEIYEEQWAAVLQVSANNTNGRFTTLAMREDEDTIRRAALGKIDAMFTAAQAARGALVNLIDTAFRRQDGDPALELLREVREDRAWDRTKPVLDRYPEPNELRQGVLAVAAEAARSADRPTLDALRHELPAYLASRKLEHYASTLLVDLDRVDADGSTPVARAAIALRADLETGWIRLVPSFDITRRCIAQREGLAVLPGFRPGQRVIPNAPDRVKPGQSR